jgi:hypothetical protein
MATFGALRNEDDAAARAIACAFELPVVVGNLGSDQPPLVHGGRRCGQCREPLKGATRELGLHDRCL